MNVEDLYKFISKRRSDEEYDALPAVKSIKEKIELLYIVTQFYSQIIINECFIPVFVYKRGSSTNNCNLGLAIISLRRFYNFSHFHDVPLEPLDLYEVKDGHVKLGDEFCEIRPDFLKNKFKGKTAAHFELVYPDDLLTTFGYERIKRDISIAFDTKQIDANLEEFFLWTLDRIKNGAVNVLTIPLQFYSRENDYHKVRHFVSQTEDKALLIDLLGFNNRNANPLYTKRELFREYELEDILDE